MILDTLTLEDVEQVRIWRNSDLTPWRTPYLLTREMQIKFYHDIISKRNAPHRYWAIRDESKRVSGDVYPYFSSPGLFLGMGGLTDISLENRNAEITLIIDPDLAGKGCGEKAVEMIYSMAFNYLNLENVYGEVYWCNKKGMGFWSKIITKYTGTTAILRNRKYWDGVCYDSDYFNINKENFNGTMRKVRNTEDTPEHDVDLGYMPSVSELQEEDRDRLPETTKRVYEDLW